MSERGGRPRLASLLPALAPIAAVLVAVTFITTNGARADEEPYAAGSTSTVDARPAGGPFEHGVSAGPKTAAATTPNPTGHTGVPYGVTPSASAPATSGAAACTVDYRVTNDWGSGFQAAVTVHNGGPNVHGWTLSWRTPTGSTITSLWNAVAHATETGVTVSNVAWNGDLESGGTVSFGFTATAGSSGGGSSATGMSDFRFNGASCAQG